MSRDELCRELFRRAKAGFPWGVAAVYLVFLFGGMFVISAPKSNALPMVTEAMAKAYGNPVTAALVQFFWSGLLGAVLSTIEVPFLLERRTLLWSAVHFLATAAVYSLAGWRCRWFPYVETWLYLLGLLLLLYVLRWSVRFLEWQADVWAIRKSSGLDTAEPPWKTLAPYLILAAAVELLLPPALMLVDAVDVPVLTGMFYPFLILPLFCFFSACSLGRRKPWRQSLGYAALCAVLPVADVFGLYNFTAIFQVGVAGVAALTGGLLGRVLWKLNSRKPGDAQKPASSEGPEKN